MQKLKATTYYPARCSAVEPDGENDYIVISAMKWDHVVGQFNVWLEHRDIERIKMEGFGIVYTNEILPRHFQLPVCYHTKAFWTYHNALWGVGNFSNPILPYESVAHSHWPFATRVEISSDSAIKICSDPDHKVWFVEDVFGKPQPPERIDFYTNGERYKGSVQADVTFPNEIRQTRAGIVSRVQGMLNKLFDENLVVDGIEGPKTMSAVHRVGRDILDLAPLASAVNGALYHELDRRTAT
jgi:hypothetical protein